MKKLLMIACCLALAACGKSVAHPYAVATMPTPVLYTKDFSGVFGGNDGKKLKFDEYGEIDELEFVALPHTVFTIEEDIPQGENMIYRVTTADYPYTTKKGYYIDARFVRTADEQPEPRHPTLPSEEEIKKSLLAANGSMYTWGGNVGD